MRIIYKDPDGVKVVIPSPHYKGTLEEIAKKRVPEGLVYKIVSDDSIPADRYFRNAWDIKSGKVITDITKAKEIKKEYIRQERKPLLEALDIEVLKNIKDSVKIDEIEGKKQLLRDITKEVDSLSTLEELKAFKILKEEEVNA